MQRTHLLYFSFQRSTIVFHENMYDSTFKLIFYSYFSDVNWNRQQYQTIRRKILRKNPIKILIPLKYVLEIEVCVDKLMF